MAGQRYFESFIVSYEVRHNVALEMKRVVRFSELHSRDRSLEIDSDSCACHRRGGGRSLDNIIPGSLL